MEAYVTTVRSLSGAGNFHELVEFLQRSSDTLVRAQPTVLATVLETLDIQQHSLGVLAVLVARLQQSSIPDWDDLFNRIAVFILECNGEQIRHWAFSFGELCHLFTDQLIQRHTPIIGIPPLLKAINKIQLSETSLTSVHADACRLCLASTFFSPALNNLLKIDYVDVSSEAAMDSKHILLFFYYGGLIFTAVKQYEKALYYFETAVTIPALAVSHIMMEAYNKYLLVSLIVHGDKSKDSIVLPKYTSPIVNKYIKPLCAPYNDLVNAYYSNQTGELQNVINKYSELFEREGNTGLVKQVSVSQTKSNIKRLTKTFVTLSLSDVAAGVGLGSSSDAERLILSMIDEGCIHARISQKDGMVQFDANPERFNSVDMLSQLESHVLNCISLNNKITQMEEEIILNASFIKKSSGGSGSAVPASTPGASRGTDLDDDFFGNVAPTSVSRTVGGGHASSSSAASGATSSQANHVGANSTGNSVPAGAANMNGPPSLH